MEGPKLSIWRIILRWMFGGSGYRADFSAVTDVSNRLMHRMEKELSKRDEQRTIDKEEIKELTGRLEKAEEKVDECEEKHKLCEALNDVLEQRVTSVEANHADCEERFKRIEERTREDTQQLRMEVQQVKAAVREGSRVVPPL